MRPLLRASLSRSPSAGGTADPRAAALAPPAAPAQVEKKRLKIIASGRCGLERLYKHLKDDAICFGVFRVYAVEAGIKQPKFFFFKWAGKDTNLKRKVVVNSVKTAVQFYL